MHLNFGITSIETQYKIHTSIHREP